MLTNCNFHCTIIENTIFKYSTLRERCRELAYLNKEVTITVIDEREGQEKEETFYFAGGISEMVLFLHENRDFLDPLYVKRPTMCGPAAGQAIRKAFSKNVGWISNFLRSGMKAGILKKHDPVQGTNYLFALVRMFALFELPEHPKKSIEKQTDELLNLFLQGLGTRAN